MAVRRPIKAQGTASTSKLGRQVAVNLKAETNLDENRGCPRHDVSFAGFLPASPRYERSVRLCGCQPPPQPEAAGDSHITKKSSVDSRKGMGNALAHAAFFIANRYSDRACTVFPGKKGCKIATPEVVPIPKRCEMRNRERGIE
jgi:hypothetical protein